MSTDEELKGNIKKLNKTLDKITELLQHLLAVQLYQSGVPQTAISKRIGIRAERVNRLLKSIKATFLDKELKQIIKRLDTIILKGIKVIGK